MCSVRPEDQISAVELRNKQQLNSNVYRKEHYHGLVVWKEQKIIPVLADVESWRLVVVQEEDYLKKQSETIKSGKSAVIKLKTKVLKNFIKINVTFENIKNRQ